MVSPPDVVGADDCAEAGNIIIGEGIADMVTFASPYVANPDLVEWFARNLPLTDADRDTFYAGGEQGHVTRE
ncbi:MAG TPA: hypothetical protein VGC14_05350 [Rhizobium sp.]